MLQSFLENGVSSRITRATVDSVEREGLVVISGAALPSTLCDVLHVSGELLTLAPMDEVLVWLPEDGSARGVILGRIGPSHVPPAAKPVADEVVIEAKSKLSLTCGEASIVLRQDGKVLIKGKDVLSRAERMNRIKGGAVAIN